MTPPRTLPLDSQDEESPQPIEKSAIATEIDSLHDKILRLASNRERLPQPLFWSLFNSRISEIKRSKDLARLLKDVLP
jgi:hypothetical protein